jgi:hypothetical protein
MSEKKSSNSGYSLSTLLFVVFLVLKLTHTVDWSWWWVTSPLWIGYALIFIILIIVATISSLK